MRKIKDLRSIAELLPRDIAPGQDAPAPDDQQEVVRSRWSQCAGRAAPMSTPLLFRSGRLVVYTPSATWATELRYMRRQILSALAPVGVIQMDIRATPQPVTPPRMGRHANALSQSSQHSLAMTAEHLTHSSLRSAMQRLANRVVGDEKAE
jgi:hypothetical protein